MLWRKTTEKGTGFVDCNIYLNNQHIKELASNSESLLNYTGSFNVTKGDRIRIIMNMDSAPDANYSYRTLPTEEDTPTPGGFRIYADVIVYAIE